MYEQSAAIAKQMIDLQRTGFEGMIGNAIIFWDQMGNAWDMFLNQAAWVPDEGKKAFREWIDSNKKGCETMKDAVNNGYASLGKCFERKA
jgi:hypothetical protein